MAQERPKFYITDDANPDDGAVWYQVNPGGDNFILVDEEEGDGEEFSREVLNGKLKLRRNDYDYVYSRPFETMFTVVLILPGEPLSATLARWRGEFYRTDCEIFEDEERIEVTPRTVDVYKTVLEGMAKKFDLIQIEPPLTPLQLQRRAVLQIYVRGANKVTNYVDSAFFEEVAVNPSEVPSTLAGTYRFGYSGRKYFITGSGTGLSPDISGVYIYSGVTFDSTREDGVYRMFFNNFPGIERVQIERISDGVIVYEGAINAPIPNVPVESDRGVLLTSLTDPSSQCRAFYVDFYSRILTNKATVGGNATYAVPSTDIVESTGVFTRIHQITYTNFLTAEGHSPTGTRWGRFPDDAQHFPGEHFTRPTGGVYYPVLQSDWYDTSFWVEYDSALLADMAEASEDYVVNHAYKIVDVVSTILDAIGTDVTHEESSAFSNFLYAASNTIRGVFRTPFIVPITNILVGDYDEPQPVANISLQDIIDLYWKALKVKWYIDSNDRFVFEHVHFFENGGSYGAPIIGTDLTGAIDAWNSKPLATAQNRYKYERSKMPERFEFGWQGKSSKPFIGYPMDINSPFVEKGNIEKWEVGLFNPDIDLIHVGGSEVSKEGFLFVDARRTEGGVYYAPFVTVVVDSEEEYNLQNGYASFVWLVPNIHRYKLPATSITVNRYPSTAITVARRKLQEVNLSTSQNVDTLALTTTNLGNGKAYRVEWEVFSNKKKINLRHVTE